MAISYAPVREVAFPMLGLTGFNHFIYFTEFTGPGAPITILVAVSVAGFPKFFTEAAIGKGDVIVRCHQGYHCRQSLKYVKESLSLCLNRRLCLFDFSYINTLALVPGLAPLPLQVSQFSQGSVRWKRYS